MKFALKLLSIIALVVCLLPSYHSTIQADDLLPAPTNVIQTSSTDSSVWISWSPVPGAIAYDVFEVGNSKPVVQYAGMTRTEVEGFSPHSTYSLTVAAIDANGKVGQQSAPITVTTRFSPPFGLSAQIDEGDKVKLSWYPDGFATKGYNIYMDGKKIASTSNGGQNSYLVDGLTYGQTYTFTVSSVDSVTESPQSNPVNITFMAKPSNFKAVTDKNNVTLTWSPVDGAVGYYLSEPNWEQHTFSLPTDLRFHPITDTSYTVTELQYGVTYTYDVKAVDAYGNVSQAAELQVKPFDPTPPPVPTNVTVVTDDNSANVSWDHIQFNNGTGGFHVYVNGALANGNFTSQESFHVTGLKTGVLYTFTVKSISPSGVESAASQPVVRELVETPTGLTVSPDLNALTLSWNPPKQKDIIGFNVRDRNTGKQYNQELIRGNQFVVTGLTTDQMYYFNVIAVTKDGYTSAPAPCGGLTQYPIPSAPTDLTATPGNHQILLSWSPSIDASTYSVFANGREIADQISGTSYVFHNPIPGEDYQFTVVANNAAGTSKESVPATLLMPTQSRAAQPVRVLMSRGDAYDALIAAGQALQKVKGAQALAQVNTAAKTLYNQSIRAYNSGQYLVAERSLMV
jgi:fibronectin type 3 domain-containing protein